MDPKVPYQTWHNFGLCPIDFFDRSAPTSRVRGQGGLALTNPGLGTPDDL
jgi:hypothetical protein